METIKKEESTEIQLLRSIAKSNKSIKGWMEFFGWITILGLIAGAIGLVATFG